MEFPYRLKLPRLKRKPQPESKEEYLALENQKLKVGNDLEFVVNTEGYKYAKAVSEAEVNNLMRRGVNEASLKPEEFGWIKGVEYVLSLFESGKRRIDEASKNIEQWKDVDA